MRIHFAAATFQRVVVCRGAVLETTLFDKDGKPTTPPDFAHRWVQQFNARGMEVEARFYAVNGDPIRVDRVIGYVRRTTIYDDHDARLERRYEIIDDKGRYALRQLEDRSGHVIEEGFYAPDGRPAPDPETGAHRCTAKYDDNGRRILVGYFDTTARPALHMDGYHTRIWRIRRRKPDCR